MPNADDRGYLLSRANAERELAAAAADPGVTLIHTQLAEEYDARAGDESHGKIALRVSRESSGVDDADKSSGAVD